MSSKGKIIVVVLCVTSFVVGFIAVPIYDSIASLDYSNMTDSAYFKAIGIDSL